MKAKFVCMCAAAVGLLSSTVSARVVWHDPYLNWDFLNSTGFVANDLEIVVDDPNFNPNVNSPLQAWSVPFTNIGLSNADYDNDGDADTIITYSGAVGAQNGTAHGGLYMKGSGLVLDAFWTFDGVQVGLSYPVTYERTRVVGDPAVYMELNIAPGFFEDPGNAGAQAGWTEIRTFLNLPAGLLDLPDINSGLDLSTLAAYEVTPRLGGPGGPVITPSTMILMSNASIADIYLGEISAEFANPQYEALLVATVVTSNSPPLPAGAFWNLNPQSPEPGTLVLLGLGGLMLMKRRV